VAGGKKAATYALGAVVRLTGLSDHTLRAWERRYGAVEPQRTPGGTRRYTEADIARLRLLRRGVEAGHPISELVKLADAEIERRLASLGESPAPPVDELLRAIERLDEPEVQRLLGVQLAALGPRDFAHSVAAPLLEEVGELWKDGQLSIAAEHGLTAALRGLLGAVLSFGRRRVSDVLILFTTPSGERHELGTLVAALCAQELGARALYLGPDLPTEEIVAAALESGASAVALGVVKRSKRELAAELRSLRRELPPAVAVWVGGAAAHGIEPPAGVRVIQDMDDLGAQVALLRERPGPPAG
jgi:DNA-binding transcriptional MerR regulator